MSRPDPPDGPRYHAFYCEENIWHLCQAPRFADRPRRVVFVSNPKRQVVLFAQRAAGPEGYVVWDYHVVLLIGPRPGPRPGDAGGWQIHDLDCTLGAPLPLERWLRASFPHVGRAEPTWDPHFRVIDGPTWVAAFASDRRHMRDGERWHVDPPPWPPIGRGHNLFDWVEMPEGDPAVYDLPRLRAAFGGV